MFERDPVAFLSYVRSDDAHEFGRITELRRTLEGEVRMQTGKAFHIFQDRNDIAWGEQWKERIESALRGVTFLIPIVTPSYFRSPSCRNEFETFLTRERELGEEHLILPIYYVACDELDAAATTDEIAAILRTRNWADWRSFRFKDLTSPELREQIALLATTIKSTIKVLETVLTASQSIGHLAERPRQIAEVPVELAPPTPFIAEVPAIRRDTESSFDPQIYKKVIENQYYAYTRLYDEVIVPAELVPAAEAMELHSRLLTSVRRDATLHRGEIARQSREIEEIGRRQNLAVIFLIDNSGSMRGARIEGIACWVSIISVILAQASIPTEVVGYTTRAWKGGNSRELWLKDGKPARPGRLNDIRYIVYKNFDQTQQEADRNIGLMLREGLLKENIDGEALLWGASRLMMRPEQRKLLFVISDGAPVDDSTLSVNRDDFLRNHCKETINWIRERADIELYGIGIDCSVSKYYGRGSPALSSNAIGPDLLIVATLALEERWKESAGIQREPALSVQPRLTTGVTPRRRRVKRAITPSSRVPGEKPLA